MKPYIKKQKRAGDIYSSVALGFPGKLKVLNSILSIYIKKKKKSSKYSKMLPWVSQIFYIYAKSYLTSS